MHLQQPRPAARRSRSCPTRVDRRVPRQAGIDRGTSHREIGALIAEIELERAGSPSLSRRPRGFGHRPAARATCSARSAAAIWNFCSMAAAGESGGGEVERRTRDSDSEARSRGAFVRGTKEWFARANVLRLAAGMARSEWLPIGRPRNHRRMHRAGVGIGPTRVWGRFRPRWNGHRPPSGDEGRRNSAGALQDRTASMCQSGVATQPLE